MNEDDYCFWSVVAGAIVGAIFTTGLILLIVDLLFSCTLTR
jgi:hypothetical protein